VLHTILCLPVEMPRRARPLQTYTPDRWVSAYNGTLRPYEPDALPDVHGSWMDDVRFFSRTISGGGSADR
jgi:hypothetical protein